MVEIVDGVARTRLRQVFRNPNSMTLEGTFMFPLPEGAAIGEFSMMMGGRMVAGEVLERDKAAAIYEGIVRRQQDPALLEYMGARLFRARVFPIPARGRAEISLTYDEVLTRRGESLEWRFPYRAGAVTRAPVGESSFRVRIATEASMMTVYSPSHSVDVEKKDDHRAVVSYHANQDPAHGDFVVVYGVGDDGAVGATLFAHKEERGGAFLLLLAPSAERRRGEDVPKDVVFVVDTSGSMRGDKLRQAQGALRHCVHGLREQDRFNIVSFSTEARDWRDRAVGATGENKAEALSFVKSLEARGGTNINDALVRAMGMSQSEDRPLMIIFVTDGHPTVGVTAQSQLLRNVTQARKALTRLFVFGVGEELNVELLDLLAEQNQGTRDYVGEKESIEVKVSSFFDKVASPVLTEVALTVDGVQVTELYPKRLPDLFRGTQLLVTGRYADPGDAVIKLTGKLGGEQVEYVFERTFRDGGDRTGFAPRLWALRKAGYLMDQMRLNGANKELEAEVVRLGKRYGIVTPLTSYLVLEDAVAGGARGRTPPIPGGRKGRSLPSGPDGGRRVRVDGPGARGAGPGVLVDAGRSGDTSESAQRTRQALEVARRSITRKPQAGSPASDGAGGQESDGGARRRLRKKYFGSTVALSQQLKSLRERRVAGGGGGMVRRVGNRTFLARAEIVVESGVLDLDTEQLVGNLRVIEAFSAEYFRLLASPGMSGVLALGDSLLFLQGGKPVQIVPAGALSRGGGEKEQ